MTTTPITSITDELLAEIEYAASHATPGEWSYGEANNKDAYEFGVRSHEWVIADICGDQPNYEADGHHIALSRPQNVLALTTELRRLRAELERSRNKISAIDSENSWLRAEVEALRVDAGRYRWLRDRIENARDMVIAKCNEWSIESWSGDDPDTAIDTAMQSNTEGN